MKRTSRSARLSVEQREPRYAPASTLAHVDGDGDLIGNVTPNGTSLVIISAHGQGMPANRSNNVAIGSLSIGGRVEHASILAGFSTALINDFDGVQITSVTVGRDWIASNLVAGIQNLGADDQAGGTGTNADNVNFCDTHDTFVGLGSVDNRIDSIVINGQVIGSTASGDHFGFSTHQVGFFRAGAITAVLTASNDVVELSPITGDVTLREV